MICCSRVACPALGANSVPPKLDHVLFAKPTPPENDGSLLGRRARQDLAPFVRFAALRLPGPSWGFPARRTLPSRAGIAQLAEQLTRNEQARGSSPLPGSNRR